MANLEKIADDLSSLTVMEAADLSKMLDEKWGVSAAAPVAVAATPGGAAAGAAEQEEFTVVLKSYGEKKINVIKEVRVITGLGLKEAQALVEAAPTAVREGIPKDRALTPKDQPEGGVAPVDDERFTRLLRRESVEGNRAEFSINRQQTVLKTDDVFQQRRSEIGPLDGSRGEVVIAGRYLQTHHGPPRRKHPAASPDVKPAGAASPRAAPTCSSTRPSSTPTTWPAATVSTPT